MKKEKIIVIIAIVFFILLIIVIFVGVKLGNFEILPISQINKENQEINTKIDTISNLTSIDYPNIIDKLEKTYDEYTIEKSRYEEIAGFNTEIKDKEQIYEKKQYDIEYLWKILGKYATKYNVTLGIQVEKNNMSENLYNLNFTISGQYVKISEFIEKIENDSDLYFRIYDFKIVYTEKEIATFTVKNVSIDSSTISTIQTPTNNTNETESNKENNNNNNIIS